MKRMSEFSASLDGSLGCMVSPAKRYLVKTDLSMPYTCSMVFGISIDPNQHV